VILVEDLVPDLKYMMRIGDGNIYFYFNNLCIGLFIIFSIRGGGVVGEEQKFLIPNFDLLIRDPDTKQFLAKEGEYKPWIGPAGRYWRRRVRSGECSIGSPIVEEKKVSTRRNSVMEEQHGD